MEDNKLPSTNGLNQATNTTLAISINITEIVEELGGGGRKMEFTNLQARRELV